MSLVVQKFGGTSLADGDRIRTVADHVARTRRHGYDVLVVVSAMGKTTDQLVRLAREVSATHPGREYDMLLSAGERISMALLCMALADLGVPAASFTGSQAGIITDTEHTKAKILEIRPYRLVEALAAGQVPVVAGFQGIGQHGELTTLGRGGTDLSAVVLAVALRAERCELFKDVGGVMEADPQLVPAARFLDVVDAIQLELLAELGAEIVHPVAVRRARRGRLKLIVRALDDDAPRTVIRPAAAGEDGALMLAVDRKERLARISLVGPARRMPELLPLPAHGEGSFDESGMRVVWAEVPLSQAAQAARAVHAALMA